jgi:hypothetical protein
MAELQTSTMVSPSVQEQEATDNTEAMAQAWDDKQEALQQDLGDGLVPDPEEQAQERPEWLPEKFTSPEDMAKAYGALEAKLGNPTEEPTDTAETAEPSEAFQSINQATEEFMEAGVLSDDTFKSLEGSGLPRELVESYIAGQQAIAESQTNAVYDITGGPESYTAMAEWATEALGETSVDAFNQIVEKGTIDQAKVAVQGLYSQYQSANGASPTLVQGNTSGNAVAPFGSSKQVSMAMRDPRYTNDPAYRNEVQQRLAISDVL